MHESTQVETDVGDRRKVCQKRRNRTPRVEPLVFQMVRRQLRDGSPYEVSGGAPPPARAAHVIASSTNFLIFSVCCAHARRLQVV